MSLLQLITDEIQRLVHFISEKQGEDGSWGFCFESSPVTDTYMIILLRSLQDTTQEEIIKQLVDRIVNKQDKQGFWKLYPDEEEGNVSATVQAYFALLYAGYHETDEENMLAAKRFILSHGGLSKTDLFTKFILSITGQYPWKNHFIVPVEFLLLPTSFPINFFDFVGYARVHIAPLLVLADKQYVVKNEQTPNLSILLVDRTSTEDGSKTNRLLTKDIVDLIDQGVQDLVGIPEQIHKKAMQTAQEYMLNRVEANGLLYSYSSATILMIFALLSLGFSPKNKVIRKAIQGLIQRICQTDKINHLQNSTSTVWDSALLSDALQQAGTNNNTDLIKKANRYLLSRQQTKYGDWAVHNEDVLPGGWGFSNINTIQPDVDDTTAALRALSQDIALKQAPISSWNRGLHWVLSMQNEDGGWPAFEKNTNKELLTWLPIEGAKSVAIDPSTADLTGRTLEFLGNYTKIPQESKSIQRAVHWLLDNQEDNGSWYGRWGISYIYGTWAALTGLIAVNVPVDHPAIKKATGWLDQIQNEDGGWGESCRSDVQKHYVSLAYSTLSQTAWALDALLSVYKKTTPSIEKGIQFLVSENVQQGFPMAASYPTGAGLPGSFYTRYHSYPYIWPLYTLSHYLKILS